MRYSELIKTEPGTEAKLEIDLLVINDDLSSEIVKGLRQKKAFDPSRVLIVADQVAPPNSPEQSGVWHQLMELANEQGIEIQAGRGMTSTFLTDGRLKPGQTAAAANLTVAAAGAVGAYGIQVSQEQLVHAFETGQVTAQAPTAEAVCLTGNLDGAMAADAGLELIRKMGLKKSGCLLTVSGTEDWSLEDRTTLCILLAQTGACPVMTGEAQEGAAEMDLFTVKPMAALSNSYETILPVSDVKPQDVKVVFIGGSAGGSFENIRMVAEALAETKIAYGVRLSVAPASAQVYRRIADAGYLSLILDAGGLVLNQCADPEIQCRVGVNETMVSNDWKNAPGYAGYDSSQVIIASTKTAIRAAMTGKIGEKSLAKEEQKGEKKAIVLEGRCWKFGDDIDTDIIIPTQWVCVPMDEMRHHAFEPLRPGLADQLREGDIIVAGDNFGCGSSREMAAEVIAVNGVRCIIAKSFARIFFRNAINNGILLIECPSLPDEVQEGDVVRVELNRQITCNGKTYPIGKIHENLYEIIADGGLVKNIEKKVKRGLL